MDVTIKDIEQNLKSLPESLLGQVNDYVDFLKGLTKNIPDWQKDEVLRRKADISGNEVGEKEMNIFIKELESE